MHALPADTKPSHTPTHIRLELYGLEVDTSSVGRIDSTRSKFVYWVLLAECLFRPQLLQRQTCQQYRQTMMSVSVFPTLEGRSHRSLACQRLNTISAASGRQGERLHLVDSLRCQAASLL